MSMYNKRDDKTWGSIYIYSFIYFAIIHLCLYTIHIYEYCGIAWMPSCAIYQNSSQRHSLCESSISKRRCRLRLMASAHSVVRDGTDLISCDSRYKPIVALPREAYLPIFVHLQMLTFTKKYKIIITVLHNNNNSSNRKHTCNKMIKYGVFWFVRRFGSDLCGVDCSSRFGADHIGHQLRTLLRHLSTAESRLRVHQKQSDGNFAFHLALRRHPNQVSHM